MTMINADDTVVFFGDDVLAHRPDVVSILIIHDTWRRSHRDDPTSTEA